MRQEIVPQLPAIRADDGSSNKVNQLTNNLTPTVRLLPGRVLTVQRNPTSRLTFR